MQRNKLLYAGAAAVAVVAVMVIGVAAVLGPGGGTGDGGRAGAGPGSGTADGDADAIVAGTDQRAYDLSRRFQEYQRRNSDLAPLIAEARQLVDEDSDHWLARMQLGQILLAAGAHEEAYEQLTAAIELDEQEPEVHLLAGTVALKLDEVDAATAHYRAAIALKPREARYRMHVAHVHMRKQEYDDARRELLVALRHDARSHQAHAGLADLYGQQNQVAPALNHIRQALELLGPERRLDDEGWEQKVLYVRRRAALLRRDLEPADALSVLQDLPAERQFEPGVMEDMARCWAMLGEPANAAAHYERALERDPYDADIAAEAAHWHLRAAQPDHARRLIDRIHRLNPRHAKLADLRDQLHATQ